MKKIRITEGTRQKIRISEHFELLDFELVSLDCTVKRCYNALLQTNEKAHYKRDSALSEFCIFQFFSASLINVKNH